MNKQRGVTLSGLIYWCVALALAAVLLLRVIPSYIEYFKLLKDAKATVAQVSSSDATVADVRKTFDRYAEVDMLDFKSTDLDISKNNGRVVIEFAYEKRIPLFANVSLVINYKGTTAE